MGKSIFEINIEAIKKYFGEAYLNDILEADDQAEEVSLETSVEGSSALKLKRDGKEMYINSKYSPLKEAQRFAEALSEFDASTVFFVYGLGPGYHIQEMRKILGENNVIIVVEPSRDIFKKALEANNMTDIIRKDNIYFFVGTDLDKLQLVFSTFLKPGNLNNFQQLVFSKYDRFYDKFYSAYIDAFKNYVISTKILINTIHYFSYEFNRNLFCNISSIIEGFAIQDFKGKFSGVPAVIVSAGPSLDKNIKDLVEGIGKCVIFSGGRPVKALLANGINPDFIVSIDPGVGAYKVIKDNLDNDIPMITTIISNERVIAEHKGKNIFIGNSGHAELMKYLKNRELDVLPQGGSVAHTCISCADYMGCDPIIFIGQDLSYTDGKYHSDSVKTVGKENNNHKGDIEVDGIHGGKVYTSQVWLSFLTWIEAYIFATKEKLFINATEGGVNIKGTTVLTLKETIGKYCSRDLDVRKTIKDVLKCENPGTEALRECLEKLELMKNDLDEVKEQAHKGMELCDKMIDYYQCNRGINIRKVLDKLDEVDKAILKYKVNNTAINDLISPTILQVELNKEFNEKINESEREKGIRLAKKSKALYAGTKNAIEQMPELIDIAISDIEKIMEEKNNEQ